MEGHHYIEEITGAGEDLLRRVEGIIQEGNVRRVVIKQNGRTVAEFPLTIGVIGAALAPVLAALGAVLAALTHCTIEVERVDLYGKPDGSKQDAAEDTARDELDRMLKDEVLPMP